MAPRRMIWPACTARRLAMSDWKRLPITCIRGYSRNQRKRVKLKLARLGSLPKAANLDRLPCHLFSRRRKQGCDTMAIYEEATHAAVAPAVFELIENSEPGCWYEANWDELPSSE